MYVFQNFLIFSIFPYSSFLFCDVFPNCCSHIHLGRPLGHFPFSFVLNTFFGSTFIHSFIHSCITSIAVFSVTFNLFLKLFSVNFLFLHLFYSLCFFPTFWISSNLILCTQWQVMYLTFSSSQTVDCRPLGEAYRGFGMVRRGERRKKKERKKERQAEKKKKKNSWWQIFCISIAIKIHRNNDMALFL